MTTLLGILKLVWLEISTDSVGMLKFIALTISTVSGVIGTLLATRAPNGKLTRAGRIILALLIASSSVAASTQAIELHLKKEADKADRVQRLQEFEALYSLTHPLRDLGVQIDIMYPITTGVSGLDRSWLKRVRRSKPTHAVLIDPADPMLPNRYDPKELREFRLLVEPEFDLLFNRTPKQAVAGLEFHTTGPKSLLHVDFVEKKINDQISAPAIRIIDNGSITSLRDLYGAELTVKLPPTAPAGSQVTRFVLAFSTSGAQFGTQIVVPLTDTDRLETPSNISYVRLLSEVELGPKPKFIQ